MECCSACIFVSVFSCRSVIFLGNWHRSGRFSDANTRVVNAAWEKVWWVSRKRVIHDHTWPWSLKWYPAFGPTALQLLQLGSWLVYILFPSLKNPGFSCKKTCGQVAEIDQDRQITSNTWVIKCPHVSHHPTIRYMVYNGYYKVMSNIPKMGQLPTPEINSPFQAPLGTSFSSTVARDLPCCSICAWNRLDV